MAGRCSACHHARTKGPAAWQDLRPARPIADNPAVARPEGLRGSTAAHGGPVASIVTATRDQPRHLRRFLGTIGTGPRTPFELILVDNGTSDTQALDLLGEAEHAGCVRVLRDARSFNFAALTNLGAAHAKGAVIVLANNDLEFPATDWLTPLVDAALDPRVAVAGARLVYPGGRIQHDGLALGGEAQVIHPGRGTLPGRLPRTDQRDARAVMAVTGALMALSRSLFDALGGMRADHYPVLYNDVDLCLRAMRNGGTNVIVECGVVHHESATIGPRNVFDPLARGGPAWRLGRALEADRFRLAWADVIDGGVMGKEADGLDGRDVDTGGGESESEAGGGSVGDETGRERP